MSLSLLGDPSKKTRPTNPPPPPPYNRPFWRYIFYPNIQQSGQEGGLAKLFTPYYDNNAAQFMIEFKVSSTRIVPSHLEGRHWDMLV